jgi:peroxiredoxin
MFCAQQVTELRPHVDQLRQAGLNVAIVGSGGPSFARGFRERLELEVPILSDEKLQAYSALGMHRGVGTLLHPGVIAAGATAIFKYRQRKTMGDATQQGGVLLVKPDGTVAWSFLSRYAGDHPKTDTIVAESLKAAS